MLIKKIKSFVGGGSPKLTDLDISSGEPLLLLNFGHEEDKRDPLLVIFTSWQKSAWTRDKGGINLRVFPYHGEGSAFNLRVRNNTGYSLGDPIPFGKLWLPNVHTKCFGPGSCEDNYQIHEVYAGREAIIETLGSINEFVPYARWFESRPSVEWLEQSRKVRAPTNR